MLIENADTVYERVRMQPILLTLFFIWTDMTERTVKTLIRLLKYDDE